MNNNYKVNLEKLDNLSIYQLREVGNKIGVKQPTNYRAKELKQEIIAIVTGIKKPYKKAKSGRPHKELITNEDWDEIIGFTNKTDPNEIFLNLDNDSTKMELFSQTSSINKRFSGQVITGYLFENSSDFILAMGEADQLKANKFVDILPFTKYISMTEPGDKITCKVSFMAPTPFIEEIHTINGQRPDELNKTQTLKVIKDVSIESKTKTISLNNQNISFKDGQRIFLHNCNNSAKLAKEFAQQLCSEYKIIYLGINKNPEDKFMVDNMECFFTDFSATTDDIIFVSQVAKARALNLSHNGYKVLFFIDDLFNIVESMSKYLGYRFSDTLTDKASIQKYSLQNLKSLFAISNSTNLGSLTITTFTNTKEYPADFNIYIDEIKNISNLFLNIK